MADTARAPGHLFVVHGQLESVRYDAVIVPTDRHFDVSSQWDRLLSGQVPSRPRGWSRGFGRSDGTEGVWFISVYDETAVTGAELAERLDALVRDIVGEIGADVGRLVVAMPVLGIRGGAQGARRGAVVRDLVDALTTISHRRGVDIAQVTPDRAVHGAIQHFRKAGTSSLWELTAEELQLAGELGSFAQQGHLALFLGAGVSMSAGLPSWGSLLTELANKAQIAAADFESLNGSPLDQAELVSLHLQDRLGSEVAALEREATQVSLAHALLAGLNCMQVVTTNYDELYEAAVDATGHKRPALLPREHAEPGRPWLLKMHGDVGDENDIVLTRRSFVRYDANSRPAGSLLQSLMMTKHLLVVGTSMSDDNVVRLAIEVDDFLRSDATFGTFIDVSQPSARAELWRKRFRWLNCAGDETADRVRRMEIVLDAIGMYAAQDASWLLDPRFAGLLTPVDREVIDEARALTRRVQRASTDLLWPLRGRLEELGAEPLSNLKEWSDLLDELPHLRRASMDQRRAPYKYVVLLWAVTRARRGADRLVAYSEVREELGELLSPFRIARSSPKASDPWFALRSSNWWELRDVPRGATENDVARLDLQGGLSRLVHRLLHEDPTFADLATQRLSRMIRDDSDGASVDMLHRRLRQGQR